MAPFRREAAAAAGAAERGLQQIEAGEGVGFAGRHVCEQADESLAQRGLSRRKAR